jgi:phage terminase small subunit
MSAAEELARADWEVGMKPTKIAAKHGLSVNTVKSWIRRKWKKGARGAPHAPAPASVDKLIADAVEENENLTPQQKDFCTYFMRCRNATQAYLKAYDCDRKTANQCGPRLLTNIHVKAELQELREIKNAALGDICGEDVIELHMRIAFADITDFVEFKNVRRPVLANGRPVTIKDPRTDEVKNVAQEVNVVHFKDSAQVDGQLILEVTEGRAGSKIKLADRQRSLRFLEQYFELNPNDRHRKEYERHRGSSAPET